MALLEASWLSQVERAPLVVDPNRGIGVQSLLALSPDTQRRIVSMKNQIAGELDVCPCKLSDCSRITLPPFTDSYRSEGRGKIQLVVDLQNGDLYKSRETLLLGKPYYSDWQYYLYFTLSL